MRDPDFQRVIEQAVERVLLTIVVAVAAAVFALLVTRGAIAPMINGVNAALDHVNEILR